MRCRGRRCGAGVGGGGVHDDARVGVIAREFRIVQLAEQVVHQGQVIIGGVKFGLDVAGDGFVLRADDLAVGGNGVGQGGQLGGGDAVIGEVGEVLVGGVKNVLAIVAGFNVVPAHQFGHGKIHGGCEGVVLDLDGVGVDGAGDWQGDVAHGRARGLLVHRDAASVLFLALGEVTDVGDVCVEVGVGVGKGLKRLPDGRAGIANSLDGEIHAQFIELFGFHGLILDYSKSLKPNRQYA